MAFQRPSRRVTFVTLHCSASDRERDDNIETMRAWHKARGWSDVGYNIFIRKSGEVLAGRSLELTPAAVAGHNTGSIAICLHGLANFPPVQLAALQALAAEIDAAYDSALTWYGHREFANKACPVFDYVGLLGLDARGDYDGPANMRGADCERDAHQGRTLRLGASGADVERLQRALAAAGYEVGPIDGQFGPRTAGAVRAFQAAAHLIADGVVGPLTAECLEPHNLG